MRERERERERERFFTCVGGFWIFIHLFSQWLTHVVSVSIKLKCLKFRFVNLNSLSYVQVSYSTLPFPFKESTPNVAFMMFVLQSECIKFNIWAEDVMRFIWRSVYINKYENYRWTNVAERKICHVCVPYPQNVF